MRASRSFPFVSKTANVDMIAIATRVMVGADPQVPPLERAKHVGVKVAQFSFNRLAGADPTLGVDMISTGEVACFGSTCEEAYLKALIATSFTLPRAKGNVLLSIGGFDAKQEFLPAARTLLVRESSVKMASRRKKLTTLHLPKPGAGLQTLRFDGYGGLLPEQQRQCHPTGLVGERGCESGRVNV